MPNRILKESICTSDNLNELTPDQEVFFYRLMVNCDDFGRMDARPQILLARCYPLKLHLVSADDIEQWLQALVEYELVFLYKVKGKRYLQLSTWDKHQQRRAKHSKYPAPPAHASTGSDLISDDITCNQVKSNVPEESRNRGIEKRGSRGIEDRDIDGLISDDVICNQVKSNVPEESRNRGIEKRGSRGIEESRNRETRNELEPERVSSDRRRKIADVFSAEYGRLLGPFEIDQIAEWEQDFPDDVIIHALKTAVLAHNRSFRYIGGILDRWKAAGVKCVQDVEVLEQRFQAEKRRRAGPEKRKSGPKKIYVMPTPTQKEAN